MYMYTVNDIYIYIYIGACVRVYICNDLHGRISFPSFSLFARSIVLRSLSLFSSSPHLPAVTLGRSFDKRVYVIAQIAASTYLHM